LRRFNIAWTARTLSFVAAVILHQCKKVLDGNNRSAESIFERQSTSAFLRNGQMVSGLGERDVGLHTANLLDNGRGEVVVTCHGGGRSEQAIGADEVSTLADRFARQPHRLIIVTPEKLRISRDAVVGSGEWIARAQTQRMTGPSELFGTRCSSTKKAPSKRGHSRSKIDDFSRYDVRSARGLSRMPGVVRSDQMTQHRL
jgi:hypothetical protein